MNPYYPIYTEKAECQDCYKCVRSCPVKAIHLEDGNASVIQEQCILCGMCVQVCPVGAKRVRNDIERIKRLLTLKPKVVASLAPSFVSDFPNIKPEQMINALKQLGFTAVSETALGAQEVSAHMAKKISSMENKIIISSACPSVVNLVKKYYPECNTMLADMFSPLLTHCRMIRQKLGNDIGIVFFGPCFSKKWEADENSDLLNIAATFKDLQQWLDQEQIDLEKIVPTKQDKFWPEQAQEGALYPIDGGMIAGIRANCTVKDTTFMTFSGVDNVIDALHDLPTLKTDGNLVLELLACRNGCINGPGCSEADKSISKRLNLINYSTYPEEKIPRKTTLDINYKPEITTIKKHEHTEENIIKTLESIGKYDKKDELNCSGCGYDNCRDFAHALLDGKAEQSMCVTYMRKLAGKKANALLKTMPSGVVIVDHKLHVIECNYNFVHLLGTDAELVYKTVPGLSGAHLEKTISFADKFQTVLENGEDLLNQKITLNDKVLLGSIFTIEANRIVGGIFQNYSKAILNKEKIIEQTQKVIEKNLATVQQIAYLLGENASETEITLDSIIKSFSEFSEGDES